MGIEESQRSEGLKLLERLGSWGWCRIERWKRLGGSGIKRWIRVLRKWWIEGSGKQNGVRWIKW
jgi:hypothetical protein